MTPLTRFCAVSLVSLGFAAYGATPREHEAFEFLRTATTFEAPVTGYAGAPSRGYLALRIVNRSADADALFKRLIGEGSAVGQIYGLIGVYRTDRAYFRSVAPRFASRSDQVATINGCLGGKSRVAEIVTTDHALIVRDGESVSDAGNWQPGARKDIAHGGYTAWYLHPRPNEQGMMQVEARADFRTHR